jgi:hypothetical protein
MFCFCGPEAADADPARDCGQARSNRSPLLDGQAYAPSVVVRMLRGPAYRLVQMASKNRRLAGISRRGDDSAATSANERLDHLMCWHRANAAGLLRETSK